MCSGEGVGREYPEPYISRSARSGLKNSRPGTDAAPGDATWSHRFFDTVGWISPWQDSTSVIDYAPATLGAFAMHLGYRRHFGERGQ